MALVFGSLGISMQTLRKHPCNNVSQWPSAIEGPEAQLTPPSQKGAPAAPEIVSENAIL